MGGAELQQMQVDAAAGVFLILSGIAIYLLFGDAAYGTACAGVGVVFLARATVRGRMDVSE